MDGYGMYREGWMGCEVYSGEVVFVKIEKVLSPSHACAAIRDTALPRLAESIRRRHSLLPFPPDHVGPLRSLLPVYISSHLVPNSIWVAVRTLLIAAHFRLPSCPYLFK